MLRGKNAIVTGSTSGIGLGIATSLADAGMNVMLNGLGDPEEIERTRAELDAGASGQVRFDGTDMTKREAIEGLVEATAEAFGSVDVLVNNVGVQHVAPIEAFPPEKFELVVALNLSAAFYATRAAFAGMKRQGFGRVINVASAHGLVASPFKSAYVATKHGLVGLTKAVALEGAEHGITVNAICPGYVLTPLVEGQIPDTAEARGMTEDEVKRDVLLAAQPTKQFVTTEQIGALAVFLCGASAASITGAALPVDGGWTAQ